VLCIDIAKTFCYNSGEMLKGAIQMAETTNLSIRIDRGLKEEADMVFGALGMNLTTAITVFVRQAVRQRKIPFEISLDAADSERGVTMAEAIAASERIWQASVLNGTDRLTMDDIDAEIAAARKERRARAGA
jgi:DNA-damage-inducible protein J